MGSKFIPYFVVMEDVEGLVSGGRGDTSGGISVMMSTTSSSSLLPPPSCDEPVAQLARYFQVHEWLQPSGGGCASGFPSGPAAAAIGGMRRQNRLSLGGDVDTAHETLMQTLRKVHGQLLRDHIRATRLIGSLLRGASEGDCDVARAHSWNSEQCAFDNPLTLNDLDSLCLALRLKGTGGSSSGDCLHSHSRSRSSSGCSSAGGHDSGRSSMNSPHGFVAGGMKGGGGSGQSTVAVSGGSLFGRTAVSTAADAESAATSSLPLPQTPSPNSGYAGSVDVFTIETPPPLSSSASSQYQRQGEGPPSRALQQESVLVVPPPLSHGVKNNRVVEVVSTDSGGAAAAAAAAVAVTGTLDYAAAAGEFLECGNGQSSTDQEVAQFLSFNGTPSSQRRLLEGPAISARDDLHSPTAMALPLSPTDNFLDFDGRYRLNSSAPPALQRSASSPVPMISQDNSVSGNFFVPLHRGSSGSSINCSSSSSSSSSGVMNSRTPKPLKRGHNMKRRSLSASTTSFHYRSSPLGRNRNPIMGSFSVARPKAVRLEDTVDWQSVHAQAADMIDATSTVETIRNSSSLPSTPVARAATEIALPATPATPNYSHAASKIVSLSAMAVASSHDSPMPMGIASPGAPYFTPKANVPQLEGPTTPLRQRKNYSCRRKHPVTQEPCNYPRKKSSHVCWLWRKEYGQAAPSVGIGMRRSASADALSAWQPIS